MSRKIHRMQARRGLNHMRDTGRYSGLKRNKLITLSILLLAMLLVLGGCGTDGAEESPRLPLSR